ncbi:MAG TPA: hypothetical protein VL362_00935 [Patescibacteria group bacterium]|jgi:hypothetical protein|nr:hypothetical protein [Patescibacteria group bacterium]
MAQHKKHPLFGLRPALERTIERAKHNHDKGEERTRELMRELADIDKRIRITLEKISHEAKHSTTSDAILRAQAKEEATLEILQVEMVRLAALYHRQSDVDIIQHFIREEHSLIGASIEATSNNPSLVSLDSQISQLHETMAEERARVRQNAHKDWIKFWVSVTIGIFSLGVSVYALTIG